MPRCDYFGRPTPEPHGNAGAGSRYTSTGLTVCVRTACHRLYAIREARRAMDLPRTPDRTERAVTDERQLTVRESVDEDNDSLREYESEP